MPKILTTRQFISMTISYGKDIHSLVDKYLNIFQTEEGNEYSWEINNQCLLIMTFGTCSQLQHFIFDDYERRRVNFFSIS